MTNSDSIFRKIGRKAFDLFGINRSIFFAFQFSDSFSAQKKMTKNQKPCIFDVGAYDGRSALTYNKLFPNSTIHSFEPFPESFEKLTANKIGSSHFLNNCAMSIQSGTATFHVNAYKATNSLLPSSQFGHNVNAGQQHESTIVVNQKTIDSYCIEHGIESIDILKLDVQGAEMLVLQGAENMLKAQKIKLIYAEVEFKQMYENQPLYEDLACYLKKFNMGFFSFYNFSYARNGQILYADAIFVLS